VNKQELSSSTRLWAQGVVNGEHWTFATNTYEYPDGETTYTFCWIANDRDKYGVVMCKDVRDWLELRRLVETLGFDWRLPDQE